MRTSDYKALRTFAINHSMGESADLRSAVASLGFIQADPIRAPARAQDLILRSRVKDYRQGDLERSYSQLGLEEDVLHVYGFMASNTRSLLQPRSSIDALSKTDRRILAFVLENGPTHPQDLEPRFGRTRALNPWGGLSRAYTRSLHRLHYLGLLRVFGRKQGVRIYSASRFEADPPAADERVRRILMLAVSLLAPIHRRTLIMIVRQCLRDLGLLDRRAPILTTMLAKGELNEVIIDEVPYIVPAAANWRGNRSMPLSTLTFVCPFDPVVWDRTRFEHFWGWPYRFEAYTPASKRQFGFYAMPMLWRNEFIGWVNVTTSRNIVTGVETQFVVRAPQSIAFKRALDEEVSRLNTFLSCRDDGDRCSEVLTRPATKRTAIAQKSS